MALTPTVASGTLIQSSWGNEIRDRTFQSFTNAAQRATDWPDAPDGARSVLGDRPEVVWFKVGGVWRYAPGQLITRATMTAPQTGLGVGPTHLTALTVTFDAAGGAIRAKAKCRIHPGAAAGNVTITYRTAGGTQLDEFDRHDLLANAQQIFAGEVAETPATGSQTRRVYITAPGGNPGAHASATEISYFEVWSA